MKKQYKKFIYLINDISSFLLKKDRIDNYVTIKKFRIVLIIFILLFTISFIINLLLILS